jgi:hypothetical protein
MKTVTLTRSRIKHSPVELGCLLRSGSDSGLFVKVVEIIPNDYPVVRELGKFNKETKKYEVTGKDTQFYDRLVVETYAHVKYGIITMSKRPLRRTGYISSYSNETAQIETQAGSTHDMWRYEVASIKKIKVTTDMAYEQGKRKRVRTEASYRHQVKNQQRHEKWAKEQGKPSNWKAPKHEQYLADRTKWDNPYGFEQYDNALCDAWVAGHIGQAYTPK